MNFLKTVERNGMDLINTVIERPHIFSVSYKSIEIYKYFKTIMHFQALKKETVTPILNLLKACRKNLFGKLVNKSVNVAQARLKMDLFSLLSNAKQIDG